MQLPISVSIKDVRVSEETLLKKSQELVDYIEVMQQASKDEIYSLPESSVYLPKDKDILLTIKTIVGEKIKNKIPRYIIVVGIGGSNLGTKAVYDALFGYYDAVDASGRPVMIFLDTLESVFMDKTLSFLKQKISSIDDVLIFIVSKSGGTTETIANAEILLASLVETFPDIKSRAVTISDASSQLRSQAESIGITTISLPDKVGGRYSVLSAVGLAPIFACGVDIDALLDGASDMVDVCQLTSHTENPAIASATVLFEALSSGHSIHDTFIFAPPLESLGKWYRQLAAESIGKEKDRDGNSVHVGITPAVSIGSTDLHSVGQLYLGGPKDKITSFVSLKDSSTNLSVPEARVFPELVKMINNKSSKTITDSILLGVKESYRKHEIPFMSIELDDISERTLGAFFQWKMMETMYLGKLLNVNPFDQPNVESYKLETKAILES